MTVAATVLVAAAMIVGSWLLVATVRSSLRSDQRSSSHDVVNNALRYLQEEAARGQTIAGDIPSTPGYVVMLLDRDGRIVGGSRGYTGGRFADVIGSAAASPIVDDDGRPFPNSVTGERHTLFVGNRVFDVLPLNVRVGDTSVGAFLVATAPMASIENSVHALKTTLWWAVPDPHRGHRPDRVGGHRARAATGRDDPRRGRPRSATPASIDACRNRARGTRSAGWPAR